MIIRLLTLVFFITLLNAEEFSEELVIRKLPDGHIYSHFNFVINKEANQCNFLNFKIEFE